MTGLSYLALEKSSTPERRYTFGPLYAPSRKDAHGEYVEPDDLQEAVWEFVQRSAKTGRAIHLQHHDYGEHVVGNWVEVCAWPYDHEVTLRKGGEAPRTLSMPAGTVYLGIIWTPDAWRLVKNGALGGLSMGGRARRVQTNIDLATLEHMGDVHKSGRVLSAKHVTDLQTCIALLEDVVAREPDRAGIAKVRNGFLVADEEKQCVYHVTAEGVETLAGSER